MEEHCIQWFCGCFLLPFQIEQIYRNLGMEKRSRSRVLDELVDYNSDARMLLDYLNLRVLGISGSHGYIAAIGRDVEKTKFTQALDVFPQGC